MSAKVIEVIEVDTIRGKGVDGDPVRAVLQYWSREGLLLAEKDPCPPDGNMARTVETLRENVGKAIEERDAARTDLEQERVRLAGCLVAAEGHATATNDCRQGDYGWSPAFEAVQVLRVAFGFAVGLASTTKGWSDKHPGELAGRMIGEAVADRAKALGPPGG